MTVTHTALLDEATAARARVWAADWPALAAVLAHLPAGQTAHLVGGSVRDLLRGMMPKDADLVLSGGVAALARQLAGRLGAARVPLHDDPPTERLVVPDGRTVDLAAYRGADLAADLRARDFTVNALAIDLAALLGDGPLAAVDPTGGLADLRHGQVRLAGPEALRADPLRLLRAYRLVATTGWRLAPATARRIRRQRRGLRRPARERVATELLLILASPRAGSTLRALTRAGLLPFTLPPLRPAAPPIRPETTAGPLAALARLTRARRDLGSLVGPDRAARLTAALAEELAPGRPRVALLGWLALTLATARTRRLTPAATRQLVTAVAAALRAGRREEREALAIAGGQGAEDGRGEQPGAATADDHAPHPRPRPAREGNAPASIPRLPAPTQSSILALAALGEAAPGALLLTWALGAAPAPATAWLCDQLDLYWNVVAPRLAAPPLVDGATLMEELGLPAGPALGRLLAALRAAQVRGDITTPGEALALARALAGRS